MKDTYYFSHDMNAIQDPKMMVALSIGGMGVIGIYWTLIEILHQQEEGKITIDSFDKYINFYCSFDKQDVAYSSKIKQVLTDSGLLLQDDKYVWSERVLKNKKNRELMSEKRAEAGKKGGLSKAKNKQSVAIAKQNVTKERKGKEIKGNNITKQTAVAVADDLNSLIGMFREVNPSYEKLYRNTTQRKALQDMLKTHGRDKVEWSINYAKQVYGKQYAPQITTPVQLEQKLGSLIAYAKSREDKKPIIAVMPINL